MVSTIRCKGEKVCVLFGMGLVATSLLKLVVRMLPESVSCSKEMCQDVQGVFGWLVDGNYIGPNLYKGSDSDFFRNRYWKDIHIYIFEITFLLVTSTHKILSYTFIYICTIHSWSGNTGRAISWCCGTRRGSWGRYIYIYTYRGMTSSRPQALFDRNWCRYWSLEFMVDVTLRMRSSWGVGSNTNV